MWGDVFQRQEIFRLAVSDCDFIMDKKFQNVKEKPALVERMSSPWDFIQKAMKTNKVVFLNKFFCTLIKYTIGTIKCKEKTNPSY